MILSIMMPLWAAAAETEEEAVQTQETVAQDLPEEAAEETDPAQDLSEEESPVPDAAGRGRPGGARGEP